MKRVFDFVVAFIALIFFAPILILLAILVRFKLGAPILFKQQRPGKDGKPFIMTKFRTMRNSVDSSGNILPDQQRMTKFGKFLRAASLDELPELWHVLTGQMSLVGPRPLLMEYLPLYNKEQAKRHNVRPGITGWAQVNGRNAIDWKTKLELDTWYVENQSLRLDIKILFMTISKVFKRSGISSDGEVTAVKFKGNN